MDNFFAKPDFKIWLKVAIPEVKEWLCKEIKYLKRNIKPPSKVLDVGCGFGRHIEVLAPFCKEVVGVDSDKKLIKRAQKKLERFNNVKLCIQDAQKLELPSNYFDCVICMTHTFGIFFNAKSKILREMKRVCKKDGKIIISLRGTSKKALEIRKKDYENLGLHIEKIENGVIYTREGLVSEHFTKKQLKEIFNQEKFKFKFTELNPVSLIGELKK